jgi:hypothetical protein
MAPERKEDAAVTFVDKDRVRIEFMIDDLVRQVKDIGVRAVASCKGCNACSASLSESGGRDDG